MDEALQTISISRLYSLLPNLESQAIGDDFFLYDTALRDKEILTRDIMDIIRYPLRFDGYVALFCVSGSINVDINLKSFELKPNSFLINIPGNILRVESRKEDIEDGHFILVGLSRSFMESVHFDFNRMFSEAMSLFDNPCFSLDEGQFSVAKDFFVLARRIMAPDMRNRKEAIGALLSSLFYVMGGYWSDILSEARQKGGIPSVRAKVLFDQFISLVTEYHTSERGMAFYADKLCLTPKYLSKLVKQVSGRSAPEWIDSFVVLEAKNMLKYSDIPIKEIVYRLHFPSQSVFYKFFKTHTGMTPSDYRNE